MEKITDGHGNLRQSRVLGCIGQRIHLRPVIVMADSELVVERLVAAGNVKRGNRWGTRERKSCIKCLVGTVLKYLAGNNL